ncbi:hypothetical protein QTI51_07300 [Variovorax sp. J22G73]|uniref:hypothetical protein n=1 Tax=unclassified Variovorax TaxID=663243 RepID=UPI002577FB58|nr:MULTISPECIES: hypothetical protein [unclassified Variovorax]MDM0003260.1 hypothetical protein [Variovorax sp. J22R203]MDM0097074.1 hypothetical protein [Variovorax sp. J22G73]
MQIAVVELPELVDPMRQFNVGIASQPRERRRGFDAAKQGEVELAEQGSARDRHGAIPDTATRVGMPVERRTDEPAFSLFLSTPRSLCFLE